MASIFSKIINEEIPGYKVYQDENYCAFLDIMPLRKGHVLVVPNKEVDYIFNLSDEELSGLMSVSKKVAKGIEKVIDCERIGVAVIGLEVPHTHVHLVPINGVADIDFSQPKLKVQEEEMKEIAEAIKKAI